MLDKEETDEQYLRRLYERFRGEVVAGGPIDYYEKDELLDIYDYAQDEGDVMVQMYVFLTASRLYPTSRVFDERIGFFLSCIANEGGLDMLAREGRRESPLWDVLAIGLRHFPDGDPSADVAKLLETYNDFDAESIIKLIDLMRDMNRVDVIVDNFNALQEKARDKRTLIYEVAETIKDLPEYVESARNLAEEMTRIEPFNIENWLLLAKIEMELEHRDEALNASEYALAIDPDNERAQLTKGVVMVADKSTREEGVAILEQILQRHPENSIALSALAEAYKRSRKKKAALQVYERYLRTDPTNGAVLIDMLKLHPADPAPYVMIFKDAVGAKESEWLSLAGKLERDDDAEMAVFLLSVYHHSFGLKVGMEYFLRLIFRIEMFEEYVTLFTNCCGKANDPDAPQYDFSLVAYLLLAVSFHRLGRKTDALSIAELLIQKHPSPSDIDEQLRLRGIIDVAKIVAHFSRSERDLSSLDPFKMPVGIDWLEIEREVAEESAPEKPSKKGKSPKKVD